MTYFEAMSAATQTQQKRAYLKPKRDTYLKSIEDVYKDLISIQSVDEIQLDLNKVDSFKKIIKDYLNPPNKPWFEEHHSLMENILSLRDEFDFKKRLLTHKLKSIYTIKCVKIPLLFKGKQIKRINEIANKSLTKEKEMLNFNYLSSKELFDKKCILKVLEKVDNVEDYLSLVELSALSFNYLETTSSFYFNHHFSNVSYFKNKKDNINMIDLLISECDLILSKASYVNSTEDIKNLQLGISVLLISNKSIIYLNEINYKECLPL